MREQKRAQENGTATGKFVRFPDPLLQKVETLAVRESRTFANTVRLLVSEALTARERRNGKAA